MLLIHLRLFPFFFVFFSFFLPFFLAEVVNFDDMVLTKSGDIGLELLYQESPSPELLNGSNSRPCKPVRFFTDTGLLKYANEI